MLKQNKLLKKTHLKEMIWSPWNTHLTSQVKLL